MRIRISGDFGEVFARLDDTPTAQTLLDALPIWCTAQKLGDEIYLGARLPVRTGHDARQVVESGTVCYWVEGASIALPFGPTPDSKAVKSRLLSHCKVLGRLEGDPRTLGRIRAGHLLTVSRA